MKKVYVAGKDIERAEKVICLLKDAGYHIEYDWVTVQDTDPSKEKAIEERQAVQDADILVYLWEQNQESARYEAGMAMGLNKPIIVSGKQDVFFFQLPNVYAVGSDEQILKCLGKIEQ